MSELLVVYFTVLGGLALLGIHRLLLTLSALRKDPPRAEAALDPSAPPVLVQLPIYNEAFVAERLLRAAARLRYPGALAIQVIDDSTDETSRLLDRAAAELRASGIDVRIVRRRDRSGYKAGALAHGLQRSDQPLIAIFDADFIPTEDFLERTVPALLAGERIGLVQARWGHVNQNASMLTRAQAIFLDGHFAIEHCARSKRGHFFNFNGTAGVWRRSAIETAGGWTGDTITEDLDLSYRAQLAGWRFEYLDHVVAPAELPERWSAFRSQQARWVRGSVETARKHLFEVLRARRLPLAVRAEAAVHLTNNFAYLWMAALACLLPAAVVLRDQLGWRVPFGQPMLSALDLTMLTAGTFAMFWFYAAAILRTDGRMTLARATDLLFALCLGAGMSISNAFEVIAGCFSRGSEFVRTPKRGDVARDRAMAQYRTRLRTTVLGIESIFLAYFAASLAYALYFELWGALPFLLLYLIGFGAVVGGHLMEMLYSSLSSRITSVTEPSSSSSSSSSSFFL
jgi:cellulose synthase/poly-beta-1,6-N-acetylglucosamine synthase-like glycosyltransferase